MHRSMASWLALAALPSVALCAELEVPAQLQGVTVDDSRGAQVDLSTTFVGEDGSDIALSELFEEGKPVLLTLNYFRCTMLCTEQLNGLVESLRGLDWTPGDQFNLVTVSIDPREGSALASAKRASYLGALDRDGAQWRFLTGREASIHQLAGDVGFRFKYDRETDQFAHPPAFMFLSPDGRVMQYLFGKQFNPRDVKFALMDASEGKVGSVFEQLVWSCFHYDDTTGAYTPFAMGIMRLGGGLTALILMVVLGLLWRRDRRQAARELAATPSVVELMT